MNFLEYSALHVLQGVGLSPGVSQGRVCRLQAHGLSVQRLSIRPEEVPEELKRLAAAVERTRQQLTEVKAQIRDKVGPERAYILDAHLLILEDSTLQSSIHGKIGQHLYSAEWAVQEVAEELLAVYRSIQDPIFRERRSDLEEVLERLAQNLQELDPQTGSNTDEDLILVAPSISLSILAEFDISHIRGLISTRGGIASHLTILARSLRIPMVTAIENLTLLGSRQRVLIDGNRGLVLVEPESIPAVVPRPAPETQDLGPHEWRPSVKTTTPDGRAVRLLANTELDIDLDQARTVGADGIGLFRTEYLFMSRKDGPVDEESQYQNYKTLAQLVGSRPAHVRTLDIGDEGHPFFLELAGESEPVLGLRGIRLGLEYPEILSAQVRAILRAAQFGNLKIVFPMISSVDELVRARQIVDESRTSLIEGGQPVPEVEVGAMLEVPAAILCLEGLADVADFFLVGTNDLTQYTLAVGRNNQRVAHLFQSLHPAVLASLAQTVAIASQTNRPVTVCGEMAAQPRLAGLLVGLGFQELSMNPCSIKAVRESLEGRSFIELEKAAVHALSLKSVAALEQFIAETPLLEAKSSQALGAAPELGRVN